MDFPEHEWLLKWLDKHFGHRDFSWLNKKYKRIRFDRVAREIREMVNAAEAEGRKKAIRERSTTRK